MKSNAVVLLICLLLTVCEAARAQSSVPVAGSRGDGNKAIADPTASPEPVAVKPGAENFGIEVETGFSYESLSNGFAPWRSAYLDVEKKFDGRRTLYGSYRETSRFSLRDRELMAGGSTPFAGRWTATLEGSFSPTHQVLAKRSVFGSIARTLGRGFVGGAGYRHTAYALTSADTGNFIVERYGENTRFAYTLYVSHLRDAGTATSHSVAGSYYYGERSSVGVVAAAGRELENLGAAGVLRTASRTIAITGRHWLNSRFALTYDAGFSRQGTIYDRGGVRVGLRFGF